MGSFTDFLPPPAQPARLRFCRIISGGIGRDRTAGDDGAYDLLDVEGDPATIGLAVAEALASCDLWQGPKGSFLERGESIYLGLTVRVSTRPLPREDDEQE